MRDRFIWQHFKKKKKKEQDKWQSSVWTAG
jgi:hypothetical protein